MISLQIDLISECWDQTWTEIHPLLLLEAGGLVRSPLPSVGWGVMKSNKGEAVKRGMAVGGQERREASKRPYSGIARGWEVTA